MIAIVASLVPLAFKEQTDIFVMIDWVTTGIFVVDYILRWWTADYKFGDKSVRSYIKYPFTFMAIVDLIAILPSLSLMGSRFAIFKPFKMLRFIKVLRTLRVFNAFKAVRHTKSMRIIKNVISNCKESLFTVGVLAVMYILISALIVFSVEPDTFDSFFEAVYWSTVSLTTVGYGDIYPSSTAGRIVAMVSSVFGIAIVALPSSIITAGYMEALIGEKKD